MTTYCHLSGFPNKFGLKGFIFGNICGATVKQGTGVWSAQTKHFAHYCTQSSSYCIATYIYIILLHVIQISFHFGYKNVFHNFDFFILVVYAFIKLRIWWSKYCSQSSSSLLLEICQLFIQVIFRFLASFEKYLPQTIFLL